VILVLHLPTVEDMAAVAAEPQADVIHLGGDLFHSVGGLVVLLVPLALNIYKPRVGADAVWLATRTEPTRERMKPVTDVSAA